MKHGCAYYIKNQNIIRVDAKDLTEELIAELKSYELYNTLEEGEENFRLFPRNSKTRTPHFYSRGERIINFSTEKDSSYHETIKHGIKKFLTNAQNKTIKFGHYEYDGKNNLSEIVRIKDYKWECEVKRSLNERGFIKADIAGQYNKTMELSDKKPWIYIEIVDTHFLSCKSFQSYIETSRKIPSLILIYLINPQYSYTERVKERYIRVNHYIQEGSFWINERRIEEKEEYKYLKNYIDNNDVKNYYEAIKTSLVDKLIKDNQDYKKERNIKEE